MPKKEIPQLTSNEYGLHIEYRSDKGRVNTICLSQRTTAGKIFATVIPKDFYKILLKRSRSGDDDVDAYMVACNSGEVFLVDVTSGDGHHELICYTNHDVVWTSIIKVSGNFSFALLESNGHFAFGHLKKRMSPSQNLEWQSVIFGMSPLCCTYAKDNLLISDGHVCFLFTFTNTSVDSRHLEYKSKKLPYYGVFKMTTKDDKIFFKTVDSRIYFKSILEIVTHNQKRALNTEMNYQSLESISLKDLMLNLKKFYEFIKKEKGRLKVMNTYIEQLSLAKSLISDFKPNLFKLKLQILPSFYARRGFMLGVDIIPEPKVKHFQGNFWQLRISLFAKCIIDCIYLDLDTLAVNNSMKAYLEVPNEFLTDALHSCDGIALVSCSLVFLDYFTQTPLCIVQMADATLDVLHFLNPHRLNGTYHLLQCDFIEFVHGLSSHSNNVLDGNKPLGSKTITSTSFYVQKHKSPVLEEVTSLKLDTLSNNVFVQLWLQKIPINIDVIVTELIKVSIASSSHDVVLAVKHSLMKRLLDVSFHPKKRKTALSSCQVFQRARVAKRILSVEAANKKNVCCVLLRLYEEISSLISRIPL